MVDLMVNSPNGGLFLVDVKGQYKKKFWPVCKQAKRDRLFYILAFVPDEERNRLFILTQDQVSEGIRTDLEQARACRKAKVLSATS